MKSIFCLLLASLLLSNILTVNHKLSAEYLLDMIRKKQVTDGTQKTNAPEGNNNTNNISADQATATLNNNITNNQSASMIQAPVAQAAQTVTPTPILLPTPQLAIPIQAPMTNTAPISLNQNLFDNYKRNMLSDNFIYFQGWVKYFRFKDLESKSKPKLFFRNDDYFAQKPENVNSNFDEVKLYIII
jgi:hypothetical protein